MRRIASDIRQHTEWWSTPIWHGTPVTAATDETAGSFTWLVYARRSNMTWPIPT
jgi:hypothetical protein